MGFLCSLFDHKNETIEYWGDQCEYILFRCKRCGHEEIFCSYEWKSLPNDDFGRKALNKMRNNKEFSKACHIHSLFVKAEKKYSINFIKLEEEFEKIRKEFNLTSKLRPACPVEMLKRGIWIDKNQKPETGSKKSSSKPKKKPIKVEPEPEFNKGEETVIIPRENIINYDYNPKVPKSKKKKFSITPEAQTLEELKRLEKIYVERENYEKAAEIYKKILKMQEDNKN